jgi:hypothetical protein
MPFSQFAEQIFRPEFESLSAGEFADRLRADGFFVAEGVVRRSCLDLIEADLRHRPLVLNTNDVGPVRWHRQTYFAHALAASRAYYELVTHRKIREIAQAYLGAAFRLKCQRYYQSGPTYELPWHTDNKTSTTERTDVRGIGIVIYFCDTYEGELQVLKSSHHWTGKTGKTEFNNQDVMAQFAEDVVTISARAGTAIFFDSQTLHRTRLITLPDFVRRSVFMQIDSDLSHSERSLLNPEFVDPNDTDLLRYLGMGMPAGYPVMPPSDMRSLNNSDLIGLAKQAMMELTRRKLPTRARQIAAGLRRRFPLA